jgi:hypothetical protein
MLPSRQANRLSVPVRSRLVPIGRAGLAGMEENDDA